MRKTEPSVDDNVHIGVDKKLLNQDKINNLDILNKYMQEDTLRNSDSFPTLDP